MGPDSAEDCGHHHRDDELNTQHRHDGYLQPAEILGLSWLDLEIMSHHAPQLLKRAEPQLVTASLAEKKQDFTRQLFIVYGGWGGKLPSSLTGDRPDGRIVSNFGEKIKMYLGERGQKKIVSFI